MRTLIDIIRLKPNDRHWEMMCRTLWREYYGLYLEKYNRDPELDEFGNQIDPWQKNTIAEGVKHGQTLGQSNLIESNRSAAIGQGLNTKSFMELLLGAYATIATGQDPAAWVATDRLAALGNGPDADNRSLAFEVFKSGLLKLFNALVIGDYSHGATTGTPGAIRFKASKFEGYLVDAWLTFLTDAPVDAKTYGRKDGAWSEVVGGAGSDGREIEISTSEGYIVWRYVGDLSWTNLVALSTLIGDPGAPGDDGREIEISTSGGYIVWRYVGDVSWTNLVDLSTLKGDTGPAGAPIQVGSLTLTAASWSLVSGTYEYNLANANILATSIVDVIPDNADVATVKTAEIYPRTESSAGSVKLYSKNLPGANIGVTINIF